MIPKAFTALKKKQKSKAFTFIQPSYFKALQGQTVAKHNI
jgi:hypothetical protein